MPNSKIITSYVAEMGTFPPLGPDLKPIGEAQPYKVLCVSIDTDINDKDLDELIGLDLTT